MEKVTSYSIKVPFVELEKFLKIDAGKIKGGYISSFSNYLEVYLND